MEQLWFEPIDYINPLIFLVYEKKWSTVPVHVNQLSLKQTCKKCYFKLDNALSKHYFWFQGGLIKRKQDMHKFCDANKAYLNLKMTIQPKTK